MNTTTSDRPTKGRITPWFGLPRPTRTSNQTGISGKKRSRVAISEPFGPVKNSRGPDFCRSDKLIMIDAINDCVEDGAALDKENSVAVKKVRRISASFPQGQPRLADSPTTASSDIMATTTLQAPLPLTSTNQLRKASLVSSCSSQGVASTSRLNLLSRLRNHHQDENALPHSRNVTSKPRNSEVPASNKLPKSRTMGMLQDIRATVSRPSLVARSPNITVSNSTIQDMSLPFVDALTPSSSRLRLPRNSSSSLARSSQTCTPEPHHTHISNAQSSQYWSGRFVALRDRYLTDNLGPECMSERMEAHGQLSHLQLPSVPQRPTHLSLSTTTSALTTLTSTPAVRPVDNEDNQCRRIFSHLESLCVNSEAKRSLHDWQQSYARLHGRASLLPRGGSMEERGFMARLFGGNTSKERRTISQDATAAQRLKKPVRRLYSKSP